MSCICVIPARMGSSRFPGKPMKPMLGMALILHVYHRARLTGSIDRVIVATCDQEIFDAVTEAGGEAIMTSDSHERCTDRVEEAISKMSKPMADDDFVLMVQGDEVLVSPDMLEQMIQAYVEDPVPVVNLVSRLYRAEDHDDPNTVKVVFSPDRRVLYYSRAPIPSRSRYDGPPMYQQTGVIGFKASFLRTFSTLPQTPLEQVESCDMLRVIEHGLPITALSTDTETIGVDTESDLVRAEQALSTDVFTQRYLKKLI